MKHLEEQAIEINTNQPITFPYDQEIPEDEDMGGIFQEAEELLKKMPSARFTPEELARDDIEPHFVGMEEASRGLPVTFEKHISEDLDEPIIEPGTGT